MLSLHSFANLPSFLHGQNRLNEHWLNSIQLEKGSLPVDAHFQRQVCSVKLYLVPNSARRYVILPFAAAKSSEVNGQVQEVQFTSGALSMGNFQRQLDDLFNEVKTMIHMGKQNEAKCLLQANFEAVKDQLDMGANGIEEAAILDVIALGYMTLGDLDMVSSLLDELEIVRELKDGEPLLDSILMHMGSMYSKLENFESSTYCYGRAIVIMERRYGKNSSSLVPPLLGLGKVLSCTGSATKAIETYHRVIKILESTKGEESEELAVPLFALGNLLIKERKVADAESLFDRVLKMYIKLFGEEDGRCGMAMSSLAHAKCAKGDVDEAIVLYKKALKIVEDSEFLEVDDNAMEKMRIDLAELLHVVGRIDEGRALLERCLMISDKHRGKEHPSSVTHLINLASSYSRSKNYSEAERLLSLGLRIMMKTVPPDDPSLTFPMLHLAITLYNMNRDEEAELLALDVIRIRESAFGKESVPVGEALDCLVSIQTRLEKDDDHLLRQLKRLLRIQERAFGHESEEVMGTLKKIVYYLGKMGKKDEIFPLRRRLSLLREKFSDMVKY